MWLMPTRRERGLMRGAEAFGGSRSASLNGAVSRPDRRAVTRRRSDHRHTSHTPPGYRLALRSYPLPVLRSQEIAWHLAPHRDTRTTRCADAGYEAVRA